MTLRNEIFEGLAAAKMAQGLIYDPREAYAEELYKAARRRNRQDEEMERERKKIKAQGPPGAVPINKYGGTLPPVASTTTPGPVLTNSPNPAALGGAVAVSTQGSPFRYDEQGMPHPAYDPFTQRGTYRRGGRVQRFQQGGMSEPIDPHELVEDPGDMTPMPTNPSQRLQRLTQRPRPIDPDTIIGEMTERAIGAPVGTDPVTGQFPDEEKRGPPPSRPPQALDTKSWGQKKAEQLAPKFRESMAVPQTDAATKIMGEDDPNNPKIPKGSKLDRAGQFALDSITYPMRKQAEGAAWLAAQLRPPPDALQQYEQDQERRRLERENTPSLLDPPEVEKEKLKARDEALKKHDTERAVKTGTMEPAEVPVRPDFKHDPNAPQPPSLSESLQPGRKPPEEYGPHLPKEQKGTNGPNVPSQSTPGGAPKQATPPPGAGTANRPTDATKPATGAPTDITKPPGSNGANVPMAPGPGGRLVPKGSLEDQTRTARYDPTADMNDPTNRKYTDFGGRDIRQVISGAMQYANGSVQPTTLGEGASSRERLNGYINAHNPQARFSPGEALLAGMISDYRMLLSFGRIEEANRMAFGLIQAATLEAASYGRSAMEMMRQGNFQTAAQQFIRGVNYFPDGMTHKLGPDGKTVTTTDNKGNVTAQTVITPQMLLQAVAGLSDGSLFWDSLQKAATLTQKPDRNATLRGLNETLRREQIEAARLRNANLRNPKARSGGRPKRELTDTERRVYGLTGGGPKPDSSSDGDGATEQQGYAGPDPYAHADVEIAEIPDDD